MGVDAVECGLQHGVGIGPWKRPSGDPNDVSGSSSAGPRSRSVQNGTTASTGVPGGASSGTGRAEETWVRTSQSETSSGASAITSRAFRSAAAASSSS